MNEIALYMNAIVAMEELCLKDNTGIVEYAWSLPQFDLAMDMTTQTDRQTRFPEWGLLTTVAAVASTDFTPLLARFTWQRERVGVMQIMFRLDSDDLGGASSVNTSLVISDGTGNMTNGTTKSQPRAPYRLGIHPTYDGRPLTARQVFDRALRTMVSGSERGIDTVVDRFEDPGIEVNSARDPVTGELLLKWRQVIKAMRMLARWMVARNRYGEVNVEILRDGENIGRVRLKQGTGTAVS